MGRKLKDALDIIPKIAQQSLSIKVFFQIPRISSEYLMETTIPQISPSGTRGNCPPIRARMNSFQ
jgi:hypothetical protein